MSRKSVLLDAGHGGNDPGAVAGGVNEADLNLDMVMEIHWFIRQRGYLADLIRVRGEAHSLTNRLDRVRMLKPTAFVSIHANAIEDNSNTPKNETDLFHGFEVYYRDDEDKKLADSINHYLEKTGLRNRGVLKDTEHIKKRLTVLNDVDVPSVLVEPGFLTNEKDRDYLQANIENVAALIGHGIIEYLEGAS